MFFLAMSTLRRFAAFFGPSRKGVQKPVHLGCNKIFILPTKAGLCFFALLLTMLLISINYNNPPGYLLTFLLAGVGFVSIFHAHRTLFGLLISHTPARAVFAGTTARFQVTVHNPNPAKRHGLRVSWSRLADGQVQDIPGKAASRFFLPCPALARGRLAADSVVVSSVHPLGLFRAWSPVHLAMSCTVYPQPEHAGPRWSASASDQAEQSGNRAEAGLIDPAGDDFIGLRAYRPGDPPRQVAWKATAKGESTVSKEFAVESIDAAIWLQWDHAARQDVEATLSRLCRWVLEADKSGRPYGLALPDRRIEPSTGPGHLAQCLTALALFKTPLEFP